MHGARPVRRRGQPRRFRRGPIPCSHDASPHCGPMAGLVSAIRHCPTDWCLVLAVDLPGLTDRELRRLADARAADLDVVTLSKTGHPEPLAAVYHIRRASFWKGCLDEGILSPIDVIRTLSWKPVLLGAATSALDGINTPDDLTRVAGW
ncbi:MAG: NTP transferase domain-containing protein [bacterium]